VAEATPSAYPPAGTVLYPDGWRTMVPVPGPKSNQPFVLVSKPLKYEVAACAAGAVIAIRPGTIRAPIPKVMPKRLIRDLINEDLLSIDDEFGLR